MVGLSAFLAEQKRKEISIRKVTIDNQEYAHAPLFYFDRLDDAKTAERERSKFFRSLNGTWKFKWFDTPLSVPSGFYTEANEATDWDDIQVRVIEEFEGQAVNVVVNGESAHSMGLEWQLSWLPTDKLSLSIAGHLIDTELDSSIRGESGPSASGIREGNELTYAPRWGVTARADLVWPLAGGHEAYAGIDLMARDGNYSSLSNDAISQTSSYGQGNIRLGFRSGPWDFTVFARNVWNERAYTSQQGAYGADLVGFGYVIMPRRIGLSLRYRY